MGQRRRILSEIAGYRGWKVDQVFWETPSGERFEPLPPGPGPDSVLVLVMARRWAPRCAHCHAIGGPVHDRAAKARRWKELPWGTRPVRLEYAPVRLRCPRCGSRAVEALAWAETNQRQTLRLQKLLAFECASMPSSHVAARHGLSWATVREAEKRAHARWLITRPPTPLRQMGVDEKYLGRRGKHPSRFVTIVSNLETGEPVWIGHGRKEATLAAFLATLSPEQKAALLVAAMDMHRPFANAIRADRALAHVVIVHDPFHVIKRAGETVTEVRREVFFRAGKELRAVGRGARWLVLRAGERLTPGQQQELKRLLAFNATLARAYQIKEELREVLRADSGVAMRRGLNRILRRTNKRANVPLRKLHDSLLGHWSAIVALAEHRVPVGRIEALNNNWETLVRRGRGYRDLEGMLLKLRFMIVNPMRGAGDVRRFLAAGVTPPPVGRRTA